MLTVTITDGAQRGRPRVLQGVGPQGRAGARRPGDVRRHGRDVRQASGSWPTPPTSSCTAATRRRRHRPRADPRLPPGQGHAELDRRRVRADSSSTSSTRCREPCRRTCAGGTRLPERLEALRGIHVTKRVAAGAAGAGSGCATRRHWSCRRLLAQRRAPAGRRSAPLARTPRAGGLLAAFDARLPFELTAGQRRSVAHAGRGAGQGHAHEPAAAGRGRVRQDDHRAARHARRGRRRRSGCAARPDGSPCGTTLSLDHDDARRPRRGWHARGQRHRHQVALLTGSQSTAARRKKAC